MNIEEVIEEAKQTAKREECSYLIYENMTSGVENDFTIAKESYGTPPNNESLNRRFKIHALIDETGYVKDSIHQTDSGSVSIEEGEPILIRFEDGREEMSVIDEVTSRSIKATNGISFKKSDLTSGWGAEPCEIVGNGETASELDPIDESEINQIEQGDTVLVSDGRRLEVTDITSRQIQTGESNFKKSDGFLWGGNDTVYICKKL